MMKYEAPMDPSVKEMVDALDIDASTICESISPTVKRSNVPSTQSRYVLHAGGGSVHERTRKLVRFLFALYHNASSHQLTTSFLLADSVV